MANCTKCAKEIKKYEKYYVCDRCGNQFCKMHGNLGSSCSKCSGGKLEERELR